MPFSAGTFSACGHRYIFLVSRLVDTEPELVRRVFARQARLQANAAQSSLMDVAIAEASSKMDEATAKLGSLVSATGGLSCKGIQEALLNSEFDANGDAGELGKKVKSTVPRHTRRIQDSDNPAFPNGQLVNFNIDRKKPFRDVEETIQVRNYDAGENDDPFIEKKVLVRVYGTDAQLN